MTQVCEPRSDGDFFVMQKFGMNGGLEESYKPPWVNKLRFGCQEDGQCFVRLRDYFNNLGQRRITNIIIDLDLRGCKGCN